MVRETKQCTKCKQQKSLSEFHKHKLTKDGFRSACKKCTNDDNKKYRRTHKIEKAEYNKKYNQTHKIERIKCARKYRKTLKGYFCRLYQYIKQRCGNPKNVAYKDYGGRGIKCLFKNTDEFINYVIINLGYDTLDKLKGLEIDRIDNDGHYEPGNVRFVTHAENMGNKERKVNKRLITIRQEQILRLCHQDFAGLSQTTVAKKLGISQSTVSNTLKRIKKILPQFFPLLSKIEAKCYYFWSEGWSVDDIAEYIGLTPNSVYKTLQRTKDKGMFFNEAKGRVLQYSPDMDINVKKRF